MLEHITKVESVDNGGGNTLDLIFLDFGKIISIDSHNIVLHDSLESFNDVETWENCPTIDIHKEK